MKFLIVALCVAVAGALAHPDVSHVVRSNNDDAHAQILKQELDVDVEGKYQWAYESDNGIAAHAHGELKNIGTENEAQHTQGQVQYTSPEGEVVQLAYTADENGYQPQGSHIPTPPPIPEAIVRALEYIRSHPPAPESRRR